jgi:hypothetical protein
VHAPDRGLRGLWGTHGNEAVAFACAHVGADGAGVNHGSECAEDAVQLLVGHAARQVGHVQLAVVRDVHRTRRAVAAPRWRCTGEARKRTRGQRAAALQSPLPLTSVQADPMCVAPLLSNGDRMSYSACLIGPNVSYWFHRPLPSSRSNTVMPAMRLACRAAFPGAQTQPGAHLPHR